MLTRPVLWWGGGEWKDLGLRKSMRACRPVQQRVTAKRFIISSPSTSDSWESIDDSIVAIFDPTQQSMDGTFDHGADPDDVVIGANISTSVHGVILAGGSDFRDNPLSSDRAVPALHLGGSFRVIDVALANLMRSGVNKLHVLTQFNSHKLNRHLTQHYPGVHIGGAASTSFVDIIACSQSPGLTGWARGSAEALQRAIPLLHTVTGGLPKPTEVLVVTGQDVFDIEFSRVINAHRSAEADITVVTSSASESAAQRRGTCCVNFLSDMLEEFQERPGPSDLDRFRFRSNYATELRPFECSSGMYVFKVQALEELLGASTGIEYTGIGKDIIPASLALGMKVLCWHHDGWISSCRSIRDYMEVNMNLASARGTEGLFEVVTASRSRSSVPLPPTKMSGKNIVHNTLISEGCILHGGKFSSSVLGPNTYVGPNAHIENCVINGSSLQQSKVAYQERRRQFGYAPGLGANVSLRQVVVDADASVGDNVKLAGMHGITEANLPDGLVVRDGLLLVLSGMRVPDGYRM